MRKLALSDEILLSVEKPARYIGNEVNSVMKTLTYVPGENSLENQDEKQYLENTQKKNRIRLAMCFPDVYEIGMSHLGIQILYDLFNKREDTWCERVYSPWVDLDKVMREQQLPLFALESQDPIKDFDFLGITIQYEMCYTNILQILELSQIPLFASERGEECPLVIGGGPCTYNPEPLADFFDLFYIGEGETVYDDLLDLYKACKTSGCSRAEFLHQAAKIPGIYVPSLYEVTYLEDGTIKAFTPKQKDIPAKIAKQVVTDVTHASYPDAPVVPFIKVTQDRVVLEIQRGCIRGCRFCQAGMVYRPNRERDLEVLKEHAKNMLKNTGHEEISLSSLSSSDYSDLEGMVTYLMEEFHDKNINISLPSLRIDAFSLDVMSKVQDVRKSSLTFAPEAGSQRLRDVINKGLTEEIILNGAGEAFEGGWNKVKLYFMLGLPTETEEDRKEIAHLANAIAVRYYEIPKDQRNGKCQITVSTSFLVPKPFTPFQWASMHEPGDYLGFAKTVNHEIREMLNQKSIKYNWHQADVTVLEGFLARGDRKAGKVILEAYRRGALFDAWTEFWNYDRWLEAFEATDTDLYFYTRRERKEDEIFPWDFIDIGVTKQFLLKEWNKAKAGEITKNCRAGCSGCGAMKYEGGVCFEGKN
ncbi:MAG: TIGR03960 family B12-binding radical SAM protein [Lachnospiraceae bacterium]|nr:TIGR03960 family B12-binding radical SAM protein [Lachnospiraceae bacterium]